MSKKTMADAARLLTSQSFAVLATTDGAKPHASIIAFAATDAATLIFLTPRRSRKYRNLRKNRQVSLVIDERPSSSAAIAASCAVTVSGTVTDIPPEKIPKLSAHFIQRHPSLRRFILDPAYALMTISVKHYAYVNNLSAVTAIRPGLLAGWLGVRTP